MTLRFKPFPLSQVGDAAVRACLLEVERMLRETMQAVSAVVAHQPPTGTAKVSAPVIPRVVATSPRQVSTMGKPGEIVRDRSNIPYIKKGDLEIADKNWEEIGVGSVYVPQSRVLTAGDGLTGLGDLSADRTVNVKVGRGNLISGANEVEVSLAYAQIWTQSADDYIDVATPSSLVQVTAFDGNSLAWLLTPDHTNDHITIDAAGTYFVMFSVSFYGNSGDRYRWVVAKNDGTVVGTVEAEVIFDATTGAGDNVCAASCGIVNFSANDTVELWFTNLDTANGAWVDHASLTVFQLST